MQSIDGVVKTMIIVRGKDRYYVDKGWIKGYRSFSFQDYYDEDHDCFGNLLVLNDEVFAPGKGFKKHPTSDIEVLTYVDEGMLETENDTVSDKVMLKSGEFQLLSYGSGMMHSEINPSREGSTRFLQFWFTPEEFDQKPKYRKISPSDDEIRNQLCLVCSKSLKSKAVIGQDVNFYVSLLEEGKTVHFTSQKGRGTLIFVLRGRLRVGTHVLEERDSLRTMSSQNFEIIAEQESKFFLVDTK